MDIKYCFSVGYRCVVDELMETMGIREFSGPFSWMVCDIETSLGFIENQFEDFTNVIRINRSNHNFCWTPNKFWAHDLFFNHKFLPADRNIDVSTIRRMCCWNHHHLDNKETLNAIHRRIKRMSDALSNKNNNTLLLYIDNLQTYSSTDVNFYYNSTLLQRFLSNKPNVQMCYLIPLIDYPNLPTLVNTNGQLNLLLYKSDASGHINDINNKNIKWDIIRDTLKSLYSFNSTE